MSKIGVPPLTNGDLRPMTNAERQQKWRLVHNGGPKYPKRDLLATCIPRGPLGRAEVERSGGATRALAGGKARNRLNSSLASIHTKARAKAVTSTGWFGKTFVFPDCAIGR